MPINGLPSPGRNVSFRLAVSEPQHPVKITITIVLRKSGVTDLSIPKFDLTAPRPEADRLDWHFWATLSGMITIAKFYLWDIGSVLFASAIEGRSEGGSPVLQNSPEGEGSRIALLNRTDHFWQTIGCRNLLLMQRKERQGRMAPPHKQ